MKRVAFLLLAVVFLIETATPLFAYNVPDDTIVYITPTGSKYHREDCTYTTTVRPLTIREAEAKGYDFCSRCRPHQLTGQYVSNWDGKGGSSGGSKDNGGNSPLKKDNATSKPDEPWYIITLKNASIFSPWVLYIVGGNIWEKLKSRR